MYRLTDQADVIVRIADGAHIPRGHRFWNEYEAWLAQGNAPQPKESLDQLQQRLLFSLDAAADAASQPYAGSELRALEYRQAAAEAQAYKDAGYKGDAPAGVQAWADAKGLSGKDAADGILAKAMAAEQALAAIRAVRLKAKEAVRNATSLDAVQTAADSALAALQALAAGAPAGAIPAEAAAKTSLWRSPLKLFSR
ncbi:phage tail protein [Chromobacterium sinusclupearum]|uniref:Phage tail protein n=1 Tax=Chromobacterium sinusclupearum TaxID=2077146 RepID=A0A2K4MRL4_9NEIS|nr:phage tail protein [Chromobacterium sinusclupearum]POA99723.1 phage tail protein [Chromobacterium sinusclupearum]